MFENKETAGPLQVSRCGRLGVMCAAVSMAQVITVWLDTGPAFSFLTALTQQLRTFQWQ